LKKRKNETLKKNTVKPLVSRISRQFENGSDENNRELEVSIYDNHELETNDDFELLNSATINRAVTVAPASNKEQVKVHVAAKKGIRAAVDQTKVTVSASSHAITNKMQSNDSIDLSRHVKFEENAVPSSTSNFAQTISEQIKAVSANFFLLQVAFLHFCIKNI
jgi:hypothetical protein